MKFSKVFCLVLSLIGPLCPATLSQQLPEIVKDGVRYYAPTQPFYNLQCVGALCPSGGSGGLTSFAGRSTPAVVPQASDYSAFYCPLSGCGTSVQIVFASIACPAYLNSDLNLGGGTDGTACASAAVAGSTASNFILFWIDKGAMLISGAGIVGPTGGNWAIRGNGSGLTQTQITACGISGGVATFTTVANSFVAGTGLTVKNLSNCSALNGQTLTILSTGLSSTQFEATVSASNVSSATENGLAVQAYGTGIFLAAGSQAVISNGHPFSGGNCEIVGGTPPSRGANVSVSDMLINGNASNQTSYCPLVQLHDLNQIKISNLVAYNASKYAIELQNDGFADVTDGTCQASGSGAANTDCIHQNGPWNDLHISGYKMVGLGDDPIALNANEGYCGPGVRTTISDSTIYASIDAIRIYNTGAVCPNGLTPTIDTVDISNYSGSVTAGLGYLGLAYGVGPVGSLNPAITNIHWTNSTITFLNSAAGFGVNENIGAFSFSHMNFINIHGAFWANATNNSSTSVGELSFNDVNFISDSTGTFPTLIANYGGQPYTVNNMVIHGLGFYNAPGGTNAPVACLLCGDTITNLVADGIDTQNIQAIHTGMSAGQIVNYQGVSPFFLDETMYDMQTANTSYHWINEALGNNQANGLSGAWRLRDSKSGYSPFGAGYNDVACVGGNMDNGLGYDCNLYSQRSGTFRTTIQNGLNVDVVKINNYTVATLPSATTSGLGAQVIVTDSTTFTPGTCTGGGSDTMIAVSNGSVWTCH